MVDLARPAFVPRPDSSRAEMEALQREIAAATVFEDDLGFDPERVCGPGHRVATLDEAIDAGRDGDESFDHDAPSDARADPPVVAGVDQAFPSDRAVSAVVAVQGGEVIERVHAVEDPEIPYVPGLLSFREGGPILAAFERLSVTPDLVLFDGSGRIHFREAGLATHLGVALDLPSVGVAKSLLCGTPRGSVEGLSEGERVAIEADGDVETTADGEVIGYAVQSRQFDSPNRHVNPLYVSPGHRVSAETAAELVLSCCAGYKLPEPVRLADRMAGEIGAGGGAGGSGSTE